MALNRKQELLLIIKELLRQSNKSIDNNQYSDNEDKIISSARELVEITKDLDSYLMELHTLNH